MKRLCFLCSDVQMTRRVVAVLHRAGVEDSNLMVVARNDIRLDELPPPGVDKTEPSACMRLNGRPLGAFEKAMRRRSRRPRLQ